MRTLFAIIFTLAFTTVVSPAFASVDRYNTMQWNPADKTDWYEWWYYKVVDQETNDAFFFVYGVVNPWDHKGSLKGTRAFVSGGNFDDMRFIENRFPVSAFRSRKDTVSVEVGSNQASDRNLRGSITDDDGGEFSWDLEMNPEWSFNAMGWGMRHKNLSNIYWYPAQASARMTGWIHYKGRTYRLENATAYQDRNWGVSFPKWWTWLVANNFEGSPGTSFAAGGGAPKALNKAFLFDGLCIGLKHQGKEYTFRTTDADLVEMNINWGTWEIWAHSNRTGHRIQISAYAPPEKFMLLPFPTPRGEVFYDYEALLGSMRIKLYEFSWTRLRWEVIADLQTNQAGIEWGTPHQIPMKEIFSQQIKLQ